MAKNSLTPPDPDRLRASYNPIKQSQKRKVATDTEKKIARAMGLTETTDGQPVGRRVWDCSNNCWRYIYD